MKSKKLLSYLSMDTFELLEQEISKDRPDNKLEDEKKKKESEIIAGTRKDLNDLKDSIRRGRKITKDFLKDGALKEKNKQFAIKHLENLKYTNMQESEKMAVLLGDYNFSGAVEQMVDNETFRRKTNFGRKVFGETRKGALGRESARRDSGAVGGEQISNIITDAFNTIEDKSTIYKNIRDAFSTYANIKDQTITDVDSFIDYFISNPEHYLKLNQFINVTGLQIADIISHGKNETYKQLAEDYNNINNIMEKATGIVDNTLDDPKKGPEARNDGKKALDKTLNGVALDQKDINDQYNKLTNNQKKYWNYLEKGGEVPQDVTDEDKNKVLSLKQQHENNKSEGLMVNKIKNDPKLFEQWIRQELTMGVLMFSTIKDGKLVPFGDPKTGEPGSKARLQAVSLDYGVNYRLGESGWTFNTGVGAGLAPLGSIITPSGRAGLGKTFEVGRGQFLSLGLLVSGWINSGSWGAGAGLGVGGSNRLNNKSLDKDLTDYVTKSLTWGVGAYMDLSRAVAYGASIGYKENKEEGIDEKVSILKSGFASVFDDLLSNLDTNKSADDNKKAIRDKIKEMYPKTKDKGRGSNELDMFVDKIVSVASLLGDTFKNTTDKDGNAIDHAFGRKKISEQLTHMVLNNRRNEEYNNLSKFTIDGFNINAAAIALGFANPIMWLAAVTPSFKIRSGVIYAEDAQTAAWSVEDKDNLIGAFEKNDSEIVDHINKILKTKDGSKVELIDDGKVISIPESVYKNTPISVNTKYKDLLSKYTKVENGNWKLPSWVGLTVHSHSKARGGSTKELKLFANKKEGKQTFEDIKVDDIAKFSGTINENVPEELQYYTQESIAKGFEDLDKSVESINLSDYFDIEYKDGKLNIYNKKSDDKGNKIRGDLVQGSPFDTKGTIVFEKSKVGDMVKIDQISVIKKPIDGPLSFEFVDKDVNGTELKFETPALSSAYSIMFEQNEIFQNGEGTLDYAKLRDLKYDRVTQPPKGFKLARGEKNLFTNSSDINKQTEWYQKKGDYYYKFTGVISAAAVLEDKNLLDKYGIDQKYLNKAYNQLPILIKNKVLGARWDQAKLNWSDNFKNFTTAMGVGDYVKASESANKMMQSNGLKYSFDATTQQNELHDFNLKIIGERAGETVTDNSIKYNKSPQDIINGRSDRFAKKRESMTGMNSDLIDRSLALNDSKEYSISTSNGVGVVLGYEDNEVMGVNYGNPKYVVNPRYLDGTKREITDETVKGSVLDKFVGTEVKEKVKDNNTWIKGQILNNLYAKLDIKDEQKEGLLKNLKDGKSFDINGKTITPKISFAFYPDCINESIIIEFDVEDNKSAKIGKESDIDTNYINNALTANSAVNASAGANVMLGRGILKQPESGTEPGVIDSNTNPDVTDVKYDIVDGVKTTTIKLSDGKVLIIGDLEDGSPMSWNYGYFEGNDFISISSGLADNADIISTLPTNVQGYIKDPSSADVTPPTTTSNDPTIEQTRRTEGNLPQATLLGVTDHVGPWKRVVDDIVKRAKKSSENKKKTDDKNNQLESK